MSAHHLPFTLEEYGARLSACREAMGRASIDILLVSSPENINYLTGYYNIGNAMYQALLVPLDGDPRFVLRKLFFEGIGGVSWITTGVAVPDTENMLDATRSEIEAMGARSARIGYDGADMHLPVDIVDGLRAGLPKATLVGVGGIVEPGASSSQPRKSITFAKPRRFRCAPWKRVSPASPPASPRTISPAPCITR